ncbi:MAG TPA: hypothetical protein VMU43_06750 [Candidatus Acidoferrum sp.]|nr:hypothetical protein [Candidatus Acidoferrum sp.]
MRARQAQDRLPDEVRSRIVLKVSMSFNAPKPSIRTYHGSQITVLVDF